MQKLSELNTKNFWVPFLFVVLIGILSFTAVFDKADTFFYDLLLKVKCAVSPQEQTSKIVPVVITDNTELLIPEKLSNREVFTDFLNIVKNMQTQGAKLSESFDFMFASAKNAEDDKVFSQAAGNTNGVFVVAPITVAQNNFSGVLMTETEESSLSKNLWFPQVLNAGKIPTAARFLLPIEQLASDASHLAHVGVTSDADGVFRRIPLFYAWNGGYVPTLSLAVFADFYSIDTSQIVIDAGHFVDIPVSNDEHVIIPIDEEGYVIIPYYGMWKDGPKQISIEDFNKALEDENTFWSTLDLVDNSVLCVSDLSTQQKDFGVSPLEAVYPLSGIHNTLLNAMFTNSFFSKININIKIILVVIFVLLAVFGLAQKKEKTFHLVYAVSFAILCIVISGMWFISLILPWFTGLAVMLISSWLVSWVFRLSSSYKEKLLLGNALSRYFPSALAKRILDEKKTDLTPAKKELTMVFSDICGFTKWSSDKPAEKVHAFLTEYLSSMAEIIFENGGTVDKFIGDGILAFFGDPYPQVDHAERAVKTAISMQRKIRELAIKWKPIVDIDLKVRVGINSGDVIVGNLGSTVRIDYTVIGAPVNLASRMESNAPVGGILVSENTYSKVKNIFKFSEAQPVSAKGYDNPVMAYVVETDF